MRAGRARAAGLLLGGMSVLSAAAPTAAQEADTAAAGAAPEARPGDPSTVGEFVYAERPDGTRLLVVPARGSTLNEGARLFFRCSAGRGEAFVAITGEEGRLGNARDGAGGRYRFGSLPWSEMEPWGSNESGSAAFMPPRLVGSFAARARASERVEIQIVNRGGVRHRYIFPMDGFDEGAAKLACFTEEGS